MNYAITGGAGHISKPLAEKLLSEGHQVTIIGRDAEHLRELVNRGAKPAAGSVEDIQFLEKAFAGADAVYTMVPPNFAVKDWKAYIAQIGKNYAGALQANNIKYVVNLSSLGAHMSEGAGPVSGLHGAEEALNELKDVNILHLRPAYFYYNFFNQAAMIRQMNIIGSNFGGENKLVLVDPADIAEVAADALLKLDFKGHEVRYIASDERTVNEIAKVLGTAVGKPDLQWTTFSDEQALGGMLQAGLPREIAKNFAEMGHALQTGEMASDYWEHRPRQLQKTKLEDFAKQFAEVYSQN